MWTPHRCSDTSRETSHPSIHPLGFRQSSLLIMDLQDSTIVHDKQFSTVVTLFSTSVLSSSTTCGIFRPWNYRDHVLNMFNYSLHHHERHWSWTSTVHILILSYFKSHMMIKSVVRFYLIYYVFMVTVYFGDYHQSGNWTGHWSPGLPLALMSLMWLHPALWQKSQFSDSNSLFHLQTQTNLEESKLQPTAENPFVVIFIFVLLQNWRFEVSSWSSWLLR